jgi:hypothetical protein
LPDSAPQQSCKAELGKSQRTDELFLRMMAIYPYTWSGQFSNEQALLIAKQEWESVLAELTDLQIQKGLNACKKNGDEFPPCIPKFRKLCLPTERELGILPKEEAFQLFLNKDFSMLLLQETKQKIDMYLFRMSPVKEARAMFNSAYNACVDSYRGDKFQGKYLE